jgi:Ca2+-binding EF-hand superfamily protein
MPHLPRDLTLAALLFTLLAAPIPAQTLPERLLSHLDSDHNGAISRAELAAAKTRQFTFADRNADGTLSAEELQFLQSRLDRAKSTLALASQRLDTDHDGALTLAEYTAQSPIFALLDADNDGSLSPAELTRAKAILHP